MDDSPAVVIYDASSNPVSIVSDSGVYRISIIGKVLNASGTQVNPATEDTLATVDSTLDAIKDTDGIKKIVDALPAGTNLLGKVQLRNPGDTVDLGDATNPVRIDPTGSTTQPISAASLPLPTGAATETTLAAADTKLGTIDSVLDSIKDVDGIKKITDSLPTGTNIIGHVVAVDGSDNAVAIVNDSGTYRFATISKIYNSSGSQINPATEDTLSAADTKLGTIDSVLDSIKDVDGIKKITDSLPAGTNEIGKVAQGTKASAANAWPEYIVDSSGNVVGVVLDGSVYRLQADAKIAKDSSGLVHLETLDVSSGLARLKATLYSQDGDAIAFGSVAPNPENINNDFVLNGTYGSDLLQDGSSTPVVFTYDADATYDTSILEVKFVIVSNSITFGSNYFGATSGPLTNGVLVEVTSNGNTGTVAVLKQNEDFVHFASSGGFSWVVSSKDMAYSDWLVGGGLKLYAGTGDNIKVTIRDDLSSAGVHFKCFVKGNLLA